MSFFSAVKRAFGFGSDDDDIYDDDAPSALVTPYQKPRQEANVSDVAEPQPNVVAEREEENSVFPLTFFDGILEIFNNAQPDFIKQCIDKEAQRRYLYNALGTSFKEFLDSCRSDIEQRVNSRSQADTKKFRDEITTLRNKCKSVEDKESEWEEQRLSADRQKRALNNRIQDLEQKVMSLEAEKEQFILENKSLVNKIKVAGVLEADASARENDNELIDELRKSELTLKEENSKLLAEVERLNAEVLENAELYKTKMKMSDQMLTDIRNNSAASRQQLSEAKEREEQLLAKIEENEREIKQMNEDLDEAQHYLASMNEINEKIGQFEEVISKRDEKIKSLKAAKDEQEVKIKSLESEIATLKDALERSVQVQVATENELKKTKEQIKESPSKQVDEKPRKRKKSIPKISAIDETLDSTEWLIATPPAGMVAKTTGGVSDTEFGYQEPPRKSTPDNAAQMSLF